jgi:hypothetical protein
MHVLYRHVHVNVDSRASTPELHNVVEYHFFFCVSGDSEHVILFVKHLFGLIYESFKKNVITSIEH